MPTWETILALLGVINGGRTLSGPGGTSGISVPDDVSSLSDFLIYTNWPARYRFGGIQWQRVRLSVYVPTSCFAVLGLTTLKFRRISEALMMVLA
jgi:hypothetical protein